MDAPPCLLRLILSLLYCTFYTETQFVYRIFTWWERYSVIRSITFRRTSKYDTAVASSVILDVRGLHRCLEMTFTESFVVSLQESPMKPRTSQFLPNSSASQSCRVFSVTSTAGKVMCFNGTRFSAWSCLGPTFSTFMDSRLQYNVPQMPTVKCGTITVQCSLSHLIY
jgi:hypothetical protein